MYIIYIHVINIKINIWHTERRKSPWESALYRISALYHIHCKLKNCIFTQFFFINFVQFYSLIETDFYCSFFLLKPNQALHPWSLSLHIFSEFVLGSKPTILPLCYVFSTLRIFFDK